MKTSLFAIAASIHLAAVAASTMVAPADLPRFLEDQDLLKRELDAWKRSVAGQFAKKQGFFTDGTTGQLESTAGDSTKRGMSEDEQLRRFFLTKLSIESLEKQNPEATFSTDTPFTLMTDQEFVKYVGQSYQRGGGFAEALHEDPSAPDASNTAMAASKDWTTTGCVAPVKNQGQCGSCWAFASVAALESAYCIQGHPLTTFSEQQVTSCDTASGGCEGGFPGDGLTFVQKNRGICLGADYPYTSGQSGETGECLSNSCTVQPVKIQQVVNVPQSEAGLVQALGGRPVAVGVAAGNNTWKQYRGGIVSSCSSTQLDHAVLAVGYDSENGTPFFKIKNSWGTSWGEGGFIRLKRGVPGAGTCGVIGPKSVYPQL